MDHSCHCRRGNAQGRPVDAPDVEPAGGVLVTVGRGPLIWLATHDRQTRLLARAAIPQILDRWAERARGMAIILNLDAMGRINTQLGYSVGDEVIIHIATLVTSHLPDGGVAARIGGDELLLLLPGVIPSEAEPPWSGSSGPSESQCGPPKGMSGCRLLQAAPP